MSLKEFELWFSHLNKKQTKLFQLQIITQKFPNLQLISMPKLQFSIPLLLLLALLAACQKKKRSQSDHIAQIKPHKKSSIPPSIRKCMNIKCEQGEQCFHGRCIKYDSLCATIVCADGERCKNGECIKQLHAPRKSICVPVNFKLQKKKCDQDLLKACGQQTVSQNVCGFNRKNRKYYDYSGPCQACTDTVCKINFYYETTCDGAPRICTQEEECMNGVCTDIFKDSTFSNYRTCNQNTDCKVNQYCAGHKCINYKDLFNYLDSKTEERPILVKV